ncbi:MAG: type III-A CRISPR-associated RAMP protein Csm3 [Caldilineaceae bacterium SB0661_bin_32]|uniref:CRISPR system Cms endoribonuclease Csm3 n=1 Tax=Caldilineaceae bacterium SB0661_bin_32 TaxID=2605255 RepID=A0A6B1D6Q3_9CHLR|nr:type III-A CRISPR-associated RAMP protein Csm3 [Caldilineaceae bacterium SB0661_bin_32]
MAETKTIKLEGRIFITFNIKAQTGLHIGGSDTGIEIGGVDKTVIRDRLTNRPYIPGSSLRGKMRSLLEKYQGLVQNQRIGQGNIHSCQQSGDYDACPVCQVFGVPGERDFGTPTRLVVRDVHMTKASAKSLQDRTELPYTEAKTEVSIDRVTSAANPRQFERVPAGAVFGPAELLYTIYNGSDCDPGKDIERVATVVEGLQLLEDDYLGGQGSRGAGQVELKEIVVKVRRNYPQAKETVGTYGSLSEWAADLSGFQAALRAKFDLTA